MKKREREYKHITLGPAWAKEPVVDPVRALTELRYNVLRGMLSRVVSSEAPAVDEIMMALEVTSDEPQRGVGHLDVILLATKLLPTTERGELVDVLRLTYCDVCGRVLEHPSRACACKRIPEIFDGDDDYVSGS